MREIAAQLKERGVLPWWDEEQSRPGQLWQQALEEVFGHIKAAAVFVGRKGVGPWQDLELAAILGELARRGGTGHSRALARPPWDAKTSELSRKFAAGRL